MTYDKVVGIIAEQLDIDAGDITADSRIIEDLKADSLDIVDLIMTFEDEFGFEFPEEDADEFKTVGDIVNYIDNNQ